MLGAGLTVVLSCFCWLARAGLSDRVEVRLQDYRDVQGDFDKIASIEMFEAVGEQYWSAYFDTLRERLAPGGKAALQIITIADHAFEGYARRPDLRGGGEILRSANGLYLGTYSFLKMPYFGNMLGQGSYLCAAKIRVFSCHGRY